ncbi:hypothetical protein BH09MYX1_BH09MYX1_59250 [soil metagenome]
MLTNRLFLLGVCAIAIPIFAIACSSKGTYEGGGRSLEPGVVPTDEAGAPPDAAADTTTLPDVQVIPDTGPKDTGQGGN